MDIKNIINDLKKYVVKTFHDNIAKLILKVQITDIVNLDNKIYVTGVDIITSDEINKIKISGLNVGNGRGIIALPKTDDIILCLNLFGEYFYLANIYDEYTFSKDNHVPIKKNEMLLINKDWGSYIRFSDKDDLIIDTIDGAKYKLNKDGSFKLLDKGGYGITSDGSGNITIFGDLTINGAINGVKYMDNDGTTDTERVAYSSNIKNNTIF